MKPSANMLFAGGATLVVCIAIAGGIVLNGSPSQVRLQRLDEQKLNDLRAISGEIANFYSAREGLPDSLQTAEELGTLSVVQRTDRETGEEYGYRVTGDSTYELCATFHLASKETNEARWSHEAGRQCFSLDASNPTVSTFGYRIR